MGEYASERPIEKQKEFNAGLLQYCRVDTIARTNGDRRGLTGSFGIYRLYHEHDILGSQLKLLSNDGGTQMSTSTHNNHYALRVANKLHLNHLSRV